MLQLIAIFINRILTFGNFRSSEIPKRVLNKLLTEFIKNFAKGEWNIIVDETINDKYGLERIRRKFKMLNNGGY